MIISASVTDDSPLCPNPGQLLRKRPFFAGGIMVQASYDRAGKIVGIAKSLRQRRVTPPVPQGLSVGVSESDDDAPVEIGRDGSSGWSIWVRYVNSKGELSRRRLKCQKLVGYATVESVYAYCFERKKVQLFRVDCIQELVDMATGEERDPFHHFNDLRFRGLMRMQDKALDDFARILIFLAKCDGEYHPLERSAIERALAAYCLRFGGDDDIVNDVIRTSNGLAPDGADMIASVKRLTRAPENSQLARLILDHMGVIVNADKRITPEEYDWSGFIEQRLRLLAQRAA